MNMNEIVTEAYLTAIRPNNAQAVLTICEVGEGTYSFSSHDSKFSPQPPSIRFCLETSQLHAFKSWGWRLKLDKVKLFHDYETKT